MIESPDLDFFLAKGTKTGKETQLQLQVVFQPQILAQVYHNIIHPSHWQLNLHNQTPQTSTRIQNQKLWSNLVHM